MTTLQESPNGHHLFPPPCSYPDSQDENRSKDSNNNNSNSRPVSTSTADAVRASSYHIPPRRFAPRPNSYRFDDFRDLPPETEPQPERCQFMFSDGRQCTMARSDIHPSLCTYHSDREEQLFGDPSWRCEARKLDFPELYSASRDLTTAAGVNRALTQVFRLLAQRRISRQEAATFGHLAQLLLRTISLMRAESTDPTRIGVPSEYHERGTSPQVGSHSDSSGLHPPGAGSVAVPLAPRPDSSSEATERRTLSAPEPATAVNSSSQPETPAASELPPVPRTPSSAPTKDPFVAPNPAAHNQHRMSTYENAEVKPVQNQHLRKNGGGQNRSQH